jgi:predicted RNA binding protein YcfA (HicA-like mRNA interferase family)
MPKLKVLGGDDLIAIFSGFGFAIESQKGSHVKLRRVLPDGTKQTLTIPVHDVFFAIESQSIFRQALRYIPEHKLKSSFYGD